MKILFILIILSFQAFAKIEVCQRPAKIAFGLVTHHWLRTDTITAGMGSARDYSKYIGDQLEAPFTAVYIIDHSDQPPTKCKEMTNHDEQCVNNELQIGVPLGRFTAINNCQTFVRKVLKKCETPEYKLFKKEKSEYYRLLHGTARHRLTSKEEKRMQELEDKYKF